MDFIILDVSDLNCSFVYYVAINTWMGNTLFDQIFYYQFYFKLFYFFSKISSKFLCSYIQVYKCVNFIVVKHGTGELVLNVVNTDN